MSASDLFSHFDNETFKTELNTLSAKLTEISAASFKTKRIGKRKRRGRK